MALALNLDPTLMKKKSDPEGPMLLVPESELSIRIGSAGQLSRKLSATDAELSQTAHAGAGGRRMGEMSGALPTSPTAAYS